MSLDRMKFATASLVGRPSGTLTDLYQLTMAAGYLRSGLADRAAVFHLFFRRCPFGSGYALACGLEQAAHALRRFGFDAADCAYLADLQGNDGRPLFEGEFLDWLSGLELAVDVDAMPEGTAVFPLEPLVRVRGPLAQCQLLETMLLTLINFPTLIATKASRICAAAGEDPVLEFGLRRAQGVDGGLTASRAAYVGGCSATSNVLAGRCYGIPVGGTHAHSWVMAFADEERAFDAFAEAQPNNATFLVDTYDSERGIERAIEAAHRLAARGHRPVGIRLDSGDLVALSRHARRRLDAAGLADLRIVASNDLDEARILELKRRGALIDVWGVGTRLATAWDEPALGGVYKLASLQRADGSWRPTVKLSEEPGKTSLPGCLQVRRGQQAGVFTGDVIYDEEDRPSTEGEDLLRPVFRGGDLVEPPPGAECARALAAEQLARLPGAVRALDGSRAYPVHLDAALEQRRRALVEKAGC